MRKYSWFSKQDASLGTSLAAVLGRGLMVACLLVASAQMSMAQKYRVNGYVLDSEGNLPDVNILDSKGKLQGKTDMEGHFDFRTNADTLVFSYVGCSPQKLASAQGQNVIVQLLSNLSLQEVLVEARLKSETIGKVPPVAKGNWMPYRIPIVIPKRLFKGNNRFVFQPRLTNLNSGKTVLMRPLVLDGKKYSATQTRMYDFDISGDPLSTYRLVSEHADSGRVALLYQDSVYLDHPRDAFTLDIYKSYENYHRVIRIDTMADYIRGAINPMRFLDYSFSSHAIADSAWWPKPNKQFMDTEGNINLEYRIGKSELDLSIPTNAEEMSRLENELLMLVGSEGVTLQSFSITGVASPDGGKGINQRLASERMNTALRYVISRLDPKTRALIDVHSKARVAEWSELSQLLRDDAKGALADKVDSILRVTPEKQQWERLRKMPEYKLIADEYLPRLRTSRYRYTYSIFRNRNVEEIRRAYSAGEVLSKFEYWKLYNAETNLKDCERILREALAKYPDFMMAANDLQVMLIDEGRSEDQLLEPFVGIYGVPEEVKFNHIIALLANQRYTDAYMMTDKLRRDNDESRLIKAFVNAMNNTPNKGDRELIASTGQMNSILMMLNAGENKQALAAILGAEELDAKGYYIKAVCFSRNNMFGLAQESLQKALKMDPELEIVARGDADIYDVYKQMKEKKK